MRFINIFAARLQRVYNDSLSSECKIGTTSTVNQYGYTRESITWATTAIRCGIGNPNTDESRDPVQQPANAVEIRLPFGTTVDVTSRIQLIKLNGTTLATAETYKILGINRGLAGVVCRAQQYVGNASNA